MDYSMLHENKKRGTFDFPIELYYVDKSSPRYKMPLHWHLEYELILILEGSFRLSLDGRQYTLGGGDSVWIGDGVIHGGEPENCVYECVVFDLEALIKNTPVCANAAAEFLLEAPFFSGPIVKKSAEAQIADKIFESMETEKKGYELMTVGLLWQLLSMLLQRAQKTHSPTLQSQSKLAKIKPVLSYIKDNYSQQITLDELAEIAGMSPKYFCRAFSELTGKTPMAYLNFYRIEIAGERLKLTDETVTETALNCGFNDLSYFARQFKKHKGQTPLKYRKNGRITG